jgi:hypothetical protein
MSIGTKVERAKSQTQISIAIKLIKELFLGYQTLLMGDYIPRNLVRYWNGEEQNGISPISKKGKHYET